MLPRYGITTGDAEGKKLALRAARWMISTVAWADRATL
jgi:hypothetical protein